MQLSLGDKSFERIATSEEIRSRERRDKATSEQLAHNRTLGHGYTPSTVLKNVYRDEPQNEKGLTRSMYDPIRVAEKIIHNLGGGGQYRDPQDAFNGMTNPMCEEFGRWASEEQKLRVANILRSYGYDVTYEPKVEKDSGSRIASKGEEIQVFRVVEAAEEGTRDPKEQDREEQEYIQHNLKRVPAPDVPTKRHKTRFYPAPTSKETIEVTKEGEEPRDIDLRKRILEQEGPEGLKEQEAFEKQRLRLRDRPDAVKPWMSQPRAPHTGPSTEEKEVWYYNGNEVEVSDEGSASKRIKHKTPVVGQPKVLILNRDNFNEAVESGVLTREKKEVKTPLEPTISKDLLWKYNGKLVIPGTSRVVEGEFGKRQVMLEDGSYTPPTDATIWQEWMQDGTVTKELTDVEVSDVYEMPNYKQLMTSYLTSESGLSEDQVATVVENLPESVTFKVQRFFGRHDKPSEMRATYADAEVIAPDVNLVLPGFNNHHTDPVTASPSKSIPWFGLYDMRKKGLIRLRAEGVPLPATSRKASLIVEALKVGDRVVNKITRQKGKVLEVADTGDGILEVLVRYEGEGYQITDGRKIVKIDKGQEHDGKSRYNITLEDGATVEDVPYDSILPTADKKWEDINDLISERPEYDSESSEEMTETRKELGLAPKILPSEMEGAREPKKGPKTHKKRDRLDLPFDVDLPSEEKKADEEGGPSYFAKYYPSERKFEHQLSKEDSWVEGEVQKMSPEEAVSANEALGKQGTEYRWVEITLPTDKPRLPRDPFAARNLEYQVGYLVGHNQASGGDTSIKGLFAPKSSAQNGYQAALSSYGQGMEPQIENRVKYYWTQIMERAEGDSSRAREIIDGVQKAIRVPEELWLGLPEANPRGRRPTNLTLPKEAYPFLEKQGYKCPKCDFTNVKRAMRFDVSAGQEVDKCVCTNHTCGWEGDETEFTAKIARKPSILERFLGIFKKG